MKNAKKTTAILISFLLAFSCLFGTVVTKAEENELSNPNIQISPANSAVKPGDTVRVDFCVNNNSGFWAALLTCKFDDGLSLVESGSIDTETGESLVKFDKGKSFSSYICVSPINNKNTLSFVYSNARTGYNNYSNGNIVSAYVKVAENASSGEYKINFTNKQVLGAGKKGIVTDEFEYVNATITVDNSAQEEPVLAIPSVNKLTVDSQNNVKVSWSAVENAQSYDIYKTEGIYTPYQKIASVDSNTLVYIDSDAPNYTDYYYMVRANYNEKYSYSKEVSITLKPNLSVDYSGKNNILTWATGANAVSYDVYRTANGTSLKIATGLTENTYTDTNAYGCIEYKYYVKGVVNAYTAKTSNTVKVSSKEIHTFDETQTVVTEPTCSESGYSTKVCEACGKTVITDFVDTKDHTPDESTKKVIEPNCIEGGYTEYTCLVCGNVYETDFTDPLGTAHQPDESTKQVVEPDCEQEGYTSYYCTLCKQTYKTDIVAPKGHTTVIQNKKSATCEEAGYTGDEVCTVCEKVVKQGEEIAPQGHTTKIQNKKAATYFAKGYSGDSVCTKCGKVVEKGKQTAKLKLKTPKITVKAGKKQFKVTYKKVKGAKGFEIRYRIKGKWIKKSVKTKKTVTTTIKKLKKGKSYTVQIRAFVKQGKKTAYSKWTKSKKVKIK